MSFPRVHGLRDAAGLALAAAILAGAVCAQSTFQEAPIATPAPHHIPADKGIAPATLADLKARGQQSVYRGDALQTIGMPCGGIGAGQLYVRGDGTLACWQIDGRIYETGYGSDNYRTYRPDAPFAQGFAVAVRTADGRVSHATLDADGYDAIEFVGEYPRALIRYRSNDRPVPPVDVALEIFSPFIPLNARDSAWPATVLRFTLRNPDAQPVQVTLAGWLENMSLHGATTTAGLLHQNRREQGTGFTGVRLLAQSRDLPPSLAPRPHVIADFETGDYTGWTATGEAFGDAPATGTLPNQQPVSGYSGDHFVNTYRNGDDTTGTLVSSPFKIDRPFVLYRIGGGHHPTETCLNLVIGDKIVRTATGQNDERLTLAAWDVRKLAGQTAHFEIVDHATGGWGHVNVDDLALTDSLPPELTRIDAGASDYGDTMLTLVGEGEATPLWPGREAFIASLDGPARRQTGVGFCDFDTPAVGTVRTDITLGPGATREVTFLITWHFPNLVDTPGRMYTNWFTDSLDVARQLVLRLDALTTWTRLFCDTYYRRTSLPWWLSQRLLMPVSNLATGTAQWWNNGRFWAWEGVGCCAGTCTHVWNYAQADAWLFPDLARSVRTMQDFGAGFDQTTGLVGFRSDRNFAADGQAGTILKAYREYLTAPDDLFLKLHWPAIRLALEYLISQDLDDDGIIDNDRQHNTYDINFVGPNTFVGSLYLAALQAGAALADRAGDHGLAARYRAIFDKGRAWTSKNLYNGEYFLQQVPPGDERPWQYGPGCLADQLFGQTWAHLLDLGYLYPPDQVRSALAAVYRYNWAPDVAPQNAAFPPERWFARPGEPGLFICTWPRGGRPKEPVRYRDEVWTGIEYQVAAGLIWENMVDEGLVVVHAVDARYDGTKHNPWNEVECGDHYARALASWGVHHALLGFTCDMPAGRIGFAPRWQPEGCEVFFCTGTAWGSFAQQRGPDSQADTLTVAYGELTLRQVDLAPPANTRIRRVDARLLAAAGTQPAESTIAAEFTQTDDRVQVKFADPVKIPTYAGLLITLQP